MTKYTIIVIGILIMLFCIAKNIYIQAYDILKKHNIDYTIDYILNNE